MCARIRRLGWHEESTIKIAPGKVVGGKVELEGDPLAEGSVVAVISTEGGEIFAVSPDEESALQAAITQADRVEVVTWDEVKQPIRSRYGS